jgi:hypothetical protein
MPNRPRDLFNLLRAVEHPASRSFLSFAKRYCNAYRNDFGWVTDGASNLSELNLLMKEVMLRRTKDGNAFASGNWSLHASAHGVIQWQPNDKIPVRELTEAAYSAPIQIHIDPSPVLLTAPATLAIASATLPASPAPPRPP